MWSEIRVERTDTIMKLKKTEKLEELVRQVEIAEVLFNEAEQEYVDLASYQLKVAQERLNLFLRQEKRQSIAAEL